MHVHPKPSLLDLHEGLMTLSRTQKTQLRHCASFEANARSTNKLFYKTLLILAHVIPTRILYKAQHILQIQN